MKVRRRPTHGLACTTSSPRLQGPVPAPTRRCAATVSHAGGWDTHVACGARGRAKLGSKSKRRSRSSHRGVQPPLPGVRLPLRAGSGRPTGAHRLLGRPGRRVPPRTTTLHRELWTIVKQLWDGASSTRTTGRRRTARLRDSLSDAEVALGYKRTHRTPDVYVKFKLTDESAVRRCTGGCADPTSSPGRRPSWTLPGNTSTGCPG